MVRKCASKTPTFEVKNSYAVYGENFKVSIFKSAQKLLNRDTKSFTYFHKMFCAALILAYMCDGTASLNHSQNIYYVYLLKIK